MKPALRESSVLKVTNVLLAYEVVAIVVGDPQCVSEGHPQCVSDATNYCICRFTVRKLCIVGSCCYTCS